MKAETEPMPTNLETEPLIDFSCAMLLTQWIGDLGCQRCVEADQQEPSATTLLAGGLHGPRKDSHDTIRQARMRKIRTITSRSRPKTPASGRRFPAFKNPT